MDKNIDISTNTSTFTLVHKVFTADLNKLGTPILRNTILKDINNKQMSVKKSLEANKKEILANLPEEFHADFEKQLQEAEDSKQMSENEVKEAVKREISPELHEHVEDLDNEINAESGAATEEEKERQINSVMTEEIQQAIKEEEATKDK